MLQSMDNFYATLEHQGVAIPTGAQVPSPEVDPQKESRSTKKRAKKTPLRLGLEPLTTLHLLHYSPPP